MEHNRNAFRYQGRFIGERRVNCESIPRLPAILIRRLLDNPQYLPCCLEWHWLSGCEVEEGIKVEHIDCRNSIRMTRNSGATQIVRIGWMPLPRYGGFGLMFACHFCEGWRRFLYGWTKSGNEVKRASWRCRTCAELRYASEGMWIPHGWRYPRTPPWEPSICP